MFRSLLISGTAMLVCWTPLTIHAQSAQPGSLPVGTTIRVILQKPLDSRKNNAGDLVIAKSTEKRMSNTNEILPKGTKIIGHLTKVKSHTKEEPESLLGIVFDRAILKGNREIPLRFIIQAVAPGQMTTIPTMSMTPATAAGTSGGMGPVTGPLTAGPMADPNSGTPAGVASPEATTQSPADNMSTRGELTPSCRGVLHMDGLVLAPENPILGSIIVSRNRNIQLDIGTQMMLRAPED
jgi:hypothetical protein